MKKRQNPNAAALSNSISQIICINIIKNVCFNCRTFGNTLFSTFVLDLVKIHLNLQLNLKNKNTAMNLDSYHIFAVLSCICFILILNAILQRLVI